MAVLDWSDLVIENITLDQFSEWISPWASLVGGTVAPLFMSKFGFWFLLRPEGHVEILDVFTGNLHRAADTYSDFISEVNETWWQEVYLLSEQISQLHDADKVPGPGQCYAIPHPAVGGPNPANGEAIDPRFVQVMDVVVWQLLCAQFVGHVG